MTGAATTIAFEDLRLDRGSFRLAVTARLDRPVTGLYGPSGAGKSTLLHVLAGLVRPTGGRVLLDGELLADGDRGLHVPPWRRRLGVVFQDGRLLPHLTVAGNLRYGERLVPRPERRFHFPDVVDLLALGPLLARRPATLSGGERQRVALGRALLTSPRALLLDEPLAALDPGRKRLVLPFFERVRDDLGIPFVYVSHDLTELLQLGDHLAILDAGLLRGPGRYADLALEGRIPTAGLVNVLRGVVQAHDRAAGLTAVALAGGACIIHAPLAEPLAPGGPAVLAVRPEDVALALARVDGISIQNQLPGRVGREREHEGQALVEVDVGVPLLVEVSRRTVRTLRLDPGREVWCLVKAAAIAYLR
jgi:molybdate transport system ATP-binding protein